MAMAKVAGKDKANHPRLGRKMEQDILLMSWVTLPFCTIVGKKKSERMRQKILLLSRRKK